jgi:hypothetical protein
MIPQVRCVIPLKIPELFAGTGLRATAWPGKCLASWFPFLFLVSDQKTSCTIADLMEVLGACVVNLEGEFQSRWGTRVIQATRIAPSLWTIMFSGVVGNALRAFADWRLEHGIALTVRNRPLPSLNTMLIHLERT